MKTPLVIIAQDPVFEELEKKINAGYKSVGEEKMFCEKRIKDSVEKNVYHVWEEVEDEIKKRGLVGEEVILGRDDSCTHRLCIRDGVLYLEKIGEQEENPLSKILGGLLGPK